MPVRPPKKRKASETETSDTVPLSSSKRIVEVSSDDDLAQTQETTEAMITCGSSRVINLYRKKIEVKKNKEDLIYSSDTAIRDPKDSVLDLRDYLKSAPIDSKSVVVRLGPDEEVNLSFRHAKWMDVLCTKRLIFYHSFMFIHHLDYLWSGKTLLL